MKIVKVAPTAVFAANEVQVREAQVSDLINAERITGKSSGFEFLAAVAASCCTFDGAAQPPEEIKNMPAADFLLLTDALGVMEAQTSQSESSTSSGKDGSEKKE